MAAYRPTREADGNLSGIYVFFFFGHRVELLAVYLEPFREAWSRLAGPLRRKADAAPGRVPALRKRQGR